MSSLTSFQEITLVSTQEIATYESKICRIFVKHYTTISTFHFCHLSKSLFFIFFHISHVDLFRKPLERIARYILAMDVS